MFSRCARRVITGLFLHCPIVVSAATINVTTLDDEDINNGDCSLREAIVAANSNSLRNGCSAGLGIDTIVFDLTGTITLTSMLPVVTEGLSIMGPGFTQLTIDGDEQFRIISFDAAVNGGFFFMRGMSLIDGVASSGNSAAIHVGTADQVTIDGLVVQGMRKTEAGSGGAIYLGSVGATLIVRRSTFSDNQTTDGFGGAIYVFLATLVVEDSTFSDNQVFGTIDDAGAIMAASGSSVTVRRSTFSANQASDDAGAIAIIAADASLTIESSTFTLNSALNDGGALRIAAGTTTISNTVVAGNLITGGAVTPTLDIVHTGGTLSSGGYNFIGDNTGAETAFPAGLPNLNNDSVGTGVSPILAGLLALANNGGPTVTHSPGPMIGLIDAGSCTGELHDQRGYGNPDGQRIVNAPAVMNADDGCDIGSVEVLGVPNFMEGIFRDGFETMDP